VAGIIAARGLAMPRGVAPRCRLLPVRVLGALRRDGGAVGAGLVDNISTGIKWAVDQGADVISMSLGVEASGTEIPHQDVIDYARRKGVTVVAASGNDGSGTTRYYPGALPYTIAVGASDPEGEVAAFSTWGRQVDLVAPGTDIYSCLPHGGYGFSTGTSHATPFVSGAAALLTSLARRGGTRPLGDGRVKHLLRNTADRLDARFRHPKAGFGRLNLLDAVRLLEHKLDHA
jgi:subtilisin family serine protease